MFKTIEFMSGVFAFFGLGMMLVMVFFFVGAFWDWFLDRADKQGMFQNFKFCGGLIIGSLVLCSFSVFTHWIYSTQYEIPRREHIEYFLNHQREFQVDSVRQIGKNALYEYCVTEK